MTSRSYWLLFLSFLGLSILGGLHAQRTMRSAGSVPRFTTPPRRQMAPLKVEVLAVKDKSDTSSHSVYGPVRLEALRTGTLFVIDDGDGEVIKELSPTGEFLHAYNTGEGGAPRLKSVTDLAYDGEYVWAADLLGSSIATLDPATGAWTTYPMTPAPYRLEPLRNGQKGFIVMRIGEPALFDLTDAVGERIRSFGRLLVDQDFHALALDGFMTRSGAALIYSGKHIGVLASLSERGEVNWIAEPVAPTEKPMVIERDGKRWVQRVPFKASLSVAADDGRLLVLTNRIDGIKVRSFVDLYHTKNGQYYKSLQLPFNSEWTSVSVGSDFLFAAHERRVVRWPKSVLGQDTAPASLSMGRSLLELTGDLPMKGAY